MKSLHSLFSRADDVELGGDGIRYRTDYTVRQQAVDWEDAWNWKGIGGWYSVDAGALVELALFFPYFFFSDSEFYTE